MSDSGDPRVEPHVFQCSRHSDGSGSKKFHYLKKVLYISARNRRVIKEIKYMSG